MSLLVIPLPPRQRLSSHRAPNAADPAPGLRLPAEFDFVFSADGRTATHSGRAAAALLPKADNVVLVLADADVSWQRIPVPKAPASRLRAALSGVMEETLLDDEEALHVALGPGATPGHAGWVAVVHKPWLAAALATLESTGQVVERVLPSSAPGRPASGHFFAADPGGDDAAVALALSRTDGVTCVRLDGTLARALLPASGEPVRWSATPAAAAAAEHWLGAPVTVRSEAERALKAAHSRRLGGANLRQFDLTARHRGTLALRDALRRLRSDEWRAVRWGLAALVAVQLLGLNAWAWQQRQTVAEKKLALNELLRSTYPGVRSVLDAPLQMQRETQRLRAAAGRPGDADLEVLLAAAAAAWPDGQGPVQALRYENGRLTVAVPGWGEPQLAQFRAQLLSAGYSAELAEGRITLAPAAASAAP